MGILIRLPSVVLSTAQILFQRFFAIKAFCKHDIPQVALASLWLACKLKENPHDINILILTYQHLDIDQQGIVNVRPLNTNSYECKKMKNNIAWHEMKILRTMGFFCVVNNIKNSLYSVVQTLRNPNIDPNKIMEESWITSNDSLCTDISLNYSSDSIACISAKYGVF